MGSFPFKGQQSPGQYRREQRGNISSALNTNDTNVSDIVGATNRQINPQSFRPGDRAYGMPAEGSGAHWGGSQAPQPVSNMSHNGYGYVSATDAWGGKDPGGFRVSDIVAATPQSTLTHALQGSSPGAIAFRPQNVSDVVRRVAEQPQVQLNQAMTQPSPSVQDIVRAVWERQRAMRGY